MTTRGKRTCHCSLLITVLLVGLYRLGLGIPLSGVNRASLASMFTGNEGTVGIFSLRYSPFLTGFIVVEIYSLILPVGRRMRHGGGEGRAKLNRIAMRTSLGLCVIQAFAIALAMEKLGAQDRLPPVPNPGWLFRLSTCVTLTAGAALIFCFAQLISRRGIANGFCILIAADTLTSILRQLELTPDAFQKVGAAHWIGYFSTLAVVVLIAIVYSQRTATTAATVAESHSSVNFDLPVFPQGVLPIRWAIWVVLQLSLIRALPGPGSNIQLPGFWPLLLVTTVLIVAFSAVGVALFSSRKRIMHNLPSGVRLDDDLERLLRCQAIKATAVLIGGSAILLTMERMIEHIPMTDYASLILLSAIALDVIEQWKFSWKHGRNVELIELDNPHLASYVKNLLESRGVDAVVQTYRFRRLLFFFGPLTKMRILVPAEDIKQAQELVDWKNIQTV